jgi:GST-like protein
MGIEGLPKVWQWNPGNGGKFAGINRPTAGARFDRVLPQGDHPLQLHSLATPNGQKVTILLEELLAAGYPADYDAWFIDIMEGDQFGSGFVAVNPNSKIPALLDRSDPSQPIRVFESGAILLYLADNFSAFIPQDLSGRT